MELDWSLSCHRTPFRRIQRGPGTPERPINADGRPASIVTECQLGVDIEATRSQTRRTANGEKGDGFFARRPSYSPVLP